MNNQEKAIEIAKNILEDKFFDDCIEELENENCGTAMDYIGEVVWEELEFDIEKEMDMNIFENLFYELQEEYLKGKLESRED